MFINISSWTELELNGAPLESLLEMKLRKMIGWFRFCFYFTENCVKEEQYFTIGGIYKGKEHIEYKSDTNRTKLFPNYIGRNGVWEEKIRTTLKILFSDSVLTYMNMKKHD